MRNATPLDRKGRVAGVERGEHVESLARGLRLLAAFTPGEPELSLTALAERTGVASGTAHRLLATLVSLGYVEQDPESRRYRPGLRVLDLGFAALSRRGLREVATPVLRELHIQIGETVNLAILDGSDVVFIERFESRDIIGTRLSVGSRLPAHCTSLGRCILAYMPPEERRAILSRGALVAMTPKTLTSVPALEADFARTLERGYAIIDEELSVHHRGVAAPVLDRQGTVVAAVSIALMASRVTVEGLCRDFAPLVVRTGRAISARLGFHSVDSAG